MQHNGCFLRPTNLKLLLLYAWKPLFHFHTVSFEEFINACKHVACSFNLCLLQCLHYLPILTCSFPLRRNATIKHHKAKNAIVLMFCTCATSKLCCTELGQNTQCILSTLPPIYWWPTLPHAEGQWCAYWRISLFWTEGTHLDATGPFSPAKHWFKKQWCLSQAHQRLPVLYRGCKEFRPYYGMLQR